METKQIVKEELAVALENLKAAGKEMSKELLEEVALELSDAFGRIAVKTDNKVDDFFLMIKPMLDKEIGKLDGEVDA